MQHPFSKLSSSTIVTIPHQTTFSFLIQGAIYHGGDSVVGTDRWELWLDNYNRIQTNYLGGLIEKEAATAALLSGWTETIRKRMGTINSVF